MIKKLVQFLSAGLLTLAVAFPALSVETDTTVIYYHHDVRGDPVVVTTEEGNVLWAEAYRAYGSAEDRVSSAGIGFGDNASENHVSRLGYTGHQSDSGSGLTYMQQRHYDPVIGRFMSNDPVGFTASNTMMFNRYAYANNNPYTYIDPDGRYASDYTAANVDQFINSEASMLLESGVARAVNVNTFTFLDSREHFKTEEGVPVVVTGRLDVYTRELPYEDTESGETLQEVGTRGDNFFVHGRLLVNVETESIKKESYDFKKDADASLARNVNTTIGRIAHGSGTEYDMHYSHSPVVHQTFDVMVKGFLENPKEYYEKNQ